MTRFSFKMFGAFEAFLNDQPITKFPTDKIRGLLVYLLMHADQPLRRDTLIGLFWPEQTEQAARQNLRQSLFRLRKTIDAIEPEASNRLLSMTRQTVTLHSEEVESDVQTMQAFKNGAAVRQPRQLEKAASLYRGEFMAGFALADATAFEEWLLLQREGWLQEILQILHTLIQHHQQEGNLAKVTEFAARQIELEPLRESAYRHLMLAAAQQGQRNKALAYFEACSELFAKELGIKPTQETIELYETIKAEAYPALSQPIVSVDLPRLSTPLIGREAEITAVLNHLQNSECRLLTILGEGGIGKTSLATAVAHHAQTTQLFPDGRFFIQLAGVVDEESIVPTISRGMGLAPSEPQRVKEHLFDFCRHKKALLILDNFEHLISAAPFLTELIDAAPQFTLLITSRESLNLKSEQRYLITGLPFPEDSQAENLNQFSAISLFVNAAQRVKPDFELTNENKTAVVDICQLVHGIPLAIEFAAAWVRLMSCDQIATEIRKNITFLSSTHRDSSPRHQSMTAVFDQSWQYLSTDEQDALAALSHFRGSFSLEAIFKITSISMIVLASLLDKSLVKRDENGRYSLHELLRQYAATKMVADYPETVELVNKHSSYYLNLIVENGDHLFSHRSPEVIQELKPEGDNIRWGWHQAVSQQQWALLEASIEPLSNYYFITGFFIEFASMLRQLHSVHQVKLPIMLQGKVIEELASIYTAQGQLDEAKKLTNSLFELGQEAGIIEFEIRANMRMGWILQYLGDYENALSCFEKAIQFYESAQAPKELAMLYDMSGHILYLLGKYDDALDVQQKAKAICQTIGNQVRLAETLNHMAHCFTATGQFDLALHHYQQALDINQKLNLTRGIGGVLHNIGRLYLRQNQEEKAISLYKEALILSKKAGARQDVALALNSVGIIYKNQQKLDEALSYYEEALAINQEIGVKAEIANNMSNIGNIYKHKKQYERAEHFFKDAILIADDANHPEGLIGHWGNLGMLYTTMEQWERGQEAFEKSIRIARKINERFFLALILISYADLLLKTGQFEKASAAATEGVALAQEMKNDSLVNEGKEILSSLSPSQ